MFGKLLKNDLKAQWFSVSAIYFCALIAVVVCEIGANVLKDQKQIVLCGGGVCLALLVASVTTLITVAIMFKNTMFGKAGYLTLTLPVKTGSHFKNCFRSYLDFYSLCTSYRFARFVALPD